MSFSMGADEASAGDGALVIRSLDTRVCAISMDRTMFGAVWVARDRESDRCTVYGEYYVPLTSLPIHAHAVKMRGNWIPIIVKTNEFGRKVGEAANLLSRLQAHELNIVGDATEYVEEAGIADLLDRMQTDRLRVDQVACRDWYRQKQTFRRGRDGKIPSEGFHLMRATALACGPGAAIAVSERKIASDEEGPREPPRSGQNVTGY